MNIRIVLTMQDWKNNLGTAEDMDRFSRRTVKVTKEHNEECRRLLGLMGIPYVVVGLYQFDGSQNAKYTRKAPSEAEAQCAELARGGKVISLHVDVVHYSDMPCQGLRCRF